LSGGKKRKKARRPFFVLQGALSAAADKAGQGEADVSPEFSQGKKIDNLSLSLGGGEREMLAGCCWRSTTTTTRRTTSTPFGARAPSADGDMTSPHPPPLASPTLTLVVMISAPPCLPGGARKLMDKSRGHCGREGQSLSEADGKGAKVGQNGRANNDLPAVFLENAGS